MLPTPDFSPALGSSDRALNPRPEAVAHEQWTPPKPALFPVDQKAPPAQFAAYTVQHLHEARASGLQESQRRIERLHAWLKRVIDERNTMKRENQCMVERIHNQREKIKRLVFSVAALKISIIQSKDDLIDEKIKNLSNPNAPVDPELEALAEMALDRVRSHDSEPSKTASGSHRSAGSDEQNQGGAQGKGET